MINNSHLTDEQIKSNIKVTTTDYHKFDGFCHPFEEGTSRRQITCGCVVCEQIKFTDGTKGYRFFNKETRHIIDDVFTSPQMRCIRDIIYFIEHEDEFSKKVTDADKK